MIKQTLKSSTTRSDVVRKVLRKPSERSIVNMPSSLLIMVFVLLLTKKRAKEIGKSINIRKIKEGIDLTK